MQVVLQSVRRGREDGAQGADGGVEAQFQPAGGEAELMKAPRAVLVAEGASECVLGGAVGAAGG